MIEQNAGRQEVQRLVLRVVYGHPEDAEVAALTTVLADVSVRVVQEKTKRKPLSLWSDRAARLRPAADALPLSHGLTSWRGSGLPVC